MLKAYFIFSIGNIRPLLVAEYPECWKSYTECTKTLTEAPDYTQIIGEVFHTLHTSSISSVTVLHRMACTALGSRSMHLNKSVVGLPHQSARAACICIAHSD